MHVCVCTYICICLERETEREREREREYCAMMSVVIVPKSTTHIVQCLPASRCVFCCKKAEIEPNHRNLQSSCQTLNGCIQIFGVNLQIRTNFSHARLALLTETSRFLKASVAVHSRYWNPSVVHPQSPSARGTSQRAIRNLLLIKNSRDLRC